LTQIAGKHSINKIKPPKTNLPKEDDLNNLVCFKFQSYFQNTLLKVAAVRFEESEGGMFNIKHTAFPY